MWINLAAIFLWATCVLAELSGQHICPTEERYTVNVTRYIVRNITVRNYIWCLQVPPRCSTYSFKVVNDSKIEEEERVRLVNKCCQGYHEDSIQERCVSWICQNCIHGTCAEENWCDCNPGYEGPDCTEACESNRWGKSCRNHCQCERGICDSRTGECICPPRWNGSRCEICSEGHSGRRCNCACTGMTLCDPVMRECISVPDHESENIGTSEDREADTFENKNPGSPANYMLAKNKEARFGEAPFQQPATLDLTTTEENYYTTRISRKHFPTKHMTRKKSTSFPYSYFSTNLHFKNKPVNNSMTDMTETTYASETPLTKFSLDSDLPVSTREAILDNVTDVITTRNFNLNIFTQASYNNTELPYNYTEIYNAEENSAAVSTRATLRDYAKSKQEMTPVNIEIERPANIMKHDPKAKVFEAGVFDTNAGHVREERFLDEEGIPYDPLNASGLFYSVLSAAFVTIALLLIVGAIIACFKIRRKKLNGQTTKVDREVANGVSTVSVTTKSIFHTPLPDPPVFENPVFTTPIEGTLNNPTTFEAHVVCSMNFPKQANYLRDSADLFYDHPPSTGSYRAAYIPEPPDTTCEKSLTHDPIYDEIPSCKKTAPVVASPPSYTSDNASLYVNTNKR